MRSSCFFRVFRVFRGENYEEVLKEVDAEIDLRVEKNYVALEQDLARKVSEIADTRGISSETLVNLWLKEKILEPV